MGKGYQLIEPQSMQWLDLFPRHNTITVFLLSWIAHKLRVRYESTHPGLIIDVIAVAYVDKYPCIAIKYPSDCIEDCDVSSDANEYIERLLSEPCLQECFLFGVRSKTSWDKLADQIMSD